MTLASLVTRFAERTPDRVAVADGSLSFTFAELEDRSSRFAALLRRHGVRPGDRVVVAGMKTALFVPVAIGIWKAAAVYMPVDPELPELRLRAMLDRAQPRVVVLLEDCALTFDALPATCLRVRASTLHELVGRSDEEEAQGPDARQVGIIVSTSGSTGVPRGVQLSHASTLAYFDGHAEIFGLDEDSRCMNTASFHYDVSIQDTFMPLSRGAFVFVNRSLFLPVFVLPQLAEHRISHLTAVVTILTLLSGPIEQLGKYDLSSLRTLSLGAEVCDPKLIHAWLRAAPKLRVFNGYGPSEVNSVSVSYEIPGIDETRVDFYPIGKPHRTVRAALIDEGGALIEKADVAGELVLGGPQLMTGYLEDPTADAQAFLEIAGQRYYRTGDLCSRDSADNYVFHGRRDFEVKVAGRRINLLEVAAVLNARPGLTDALVTTVAIGEEKRIVAFCRADDRAASTVGDDLMQELTTRFPSYMIPRHIALFAEPPHTRTGKLDQKALEAHLAAALPKSGARFFVFDRARDAFIARSEYKSALESAQRLEA